MAGRIALALVVGWMVIQGAMCVGRQRQIDACADAWRHGSSEYWQYDPRCEGVSPADLDTALRQH